MTDRFNLRPLFAGHWKTLSIDQHDEEESTKPDWLARIGLLLPAVTVGLVMWCNEGRLANPGAILAGASLMSGTLLAVFAQIASLRLKLADRFERGYKGADADKDALDESVSHILFAALLTFVSAAVITIALSMAPPESRAITGFPAALAGALLSYVLLLILMLLPRLLYAYNRVNKVRSQLNGFYKE
ncbi:hypothetical protein JVX90_13920 [Gordonia sp. PDNC005]|uniref:hypothetical protein n=1 Tax=Gordonia sp. PDNC005 TaxID=2811424 RepID=UPI00196692CA|nr:hypothetical protein [Gordonia sp. PDNC005]QRY61510.1 hypothetical protein JVX90_13920 [Gordonia sp. PDNC005]